MTGQEIRDAVAAARGITPGLIRGPSRARVYSRPRQEAMWLIRTVAVPRLSYPAIANLFNGRDHSTAMSAVRAVQKRVDADPGYGDRLRAIVAPVEAA